MLTACFLVLGHATPTKFEPAAKLPLEAPEPRRAEGQHASTSTIESGATRPAFATLALYAAASASPEGITFTGYITLLKIAPNCAARFVDFSASRLVSGQPTMGYKPSVAIINQRFCVKVVSDPAISKLIGRQLLLRPVPLSEFLNGEEYSSPDPADLQAAGVSVYLPDDRFGHQIGIFVLAGYLEAADGVIRQAHAIVGAAVRSGGQGLHEQRHLLTLLSPAGTAVNAMGRAPTVELALQK